YFPHSRERSYLRFGTRLTPPIDEPPNASCSSRYSVAPSISPRKRRWIGRQHCVNDSNERTHTRSRSGARARALSRDQREQRRPVDVQTFEGSWVPRADG